MEKHESPEPPKPAQREIDHAKIQLMIGDDPINPGRKLFTTDPTGRISLAKDAAGVLAGLTAEELMNVARSVQNDLATIFPDLGPDPITALAELADEYEQTGRGMSPPLLAARALIQRDQIVCRGCSAAGGAQIDIRHSRPSCDGPPLEIQRQRPEEKIDNPHSWERGPG